VLPLDRAAARHLEQVLRLGQADPVDYTDGAGTFGRGRFTGGAVERGAEELRERLPRLVVAVAPLRAKDRLRFLVEKLVELATTEVWWLRSEFVQGPSPRTEKVHTWAVAGLEQSRGAWLPAFREANWTDVLASDLPVRVLDGAGGDHQLVAPCLLVIGPEGGFSPTEVPGHLPRVRLTDTVLRTETAAVLGAGLARTRTFM
jgi:16S rRNA (uracil1498-N3)-methyltransferase